MREPDLDIGTAIITRRFDLAGGGHVDIYLWKPRAVPDAHICTCSIIGLGSEKPLDIHGVDDVQAVSLALQAVGLRLYHSEEYKAGRLTWFGGRDLGLPTLPGEKPGGGYEPAELLTSASYSSVVRMPGNRFPYVAYPGARLNDLIVTLKEISDCVTGDEDARSGLQALIEGLTRERTYYEAVSRDTGDHPSYITPADDAAG